MGVLADIVIDAAHAASLARFWAAALDGYEVAPYDDEERARLAGLGIHDVEDDPSVLVQPVSGQGPRLFVTAVPEPKTVKNRVHLDLMALDVSEEVRRLVALGAVEIGGGSDWVTLTDPEGNEFDVVPHHGSPS